MIGATFAQALSDGRPWFNDRVADAQRRFPGFDTAAFSAFLQTGVDDLINATALIDAARVAPVTRAAFELALELTGQGLIKSEGRSDTIMLAWSALAPQLGALVVHCVCCCVLCVGGG